MSPSRAWEIVDQAARELRQAKLSTTAAARLNEVMRQVRSKGDRREYRLLFGHAPGGIVLLGLRFFVKKQQKTPQREIDVAEQRLAAWLRRGRLD